MFGFGTFSRKKSRKLDLETYERRKNNETLVTEYSRVYKKQIARTCENLLVSKRPNQAKLNSLTISLNAIRLKLHSSREIFFILILKIIVLLVNNCVEFLKRGSILKTYDFQTILFYNIERYLIFGKLVFILYTVSKKPIEKLLSHVAFSWTTFQIIYNFMYTTNGRLAFVQRAFEFIILFYIG